MISLILFSLLPLIVLSANITKNSTLSEIVFDKRTDFYYWRDYHGIIPHDAYAGGSDIDGNPTFIGQTYFSDKNHLLPSIITPGDRNAYLVVGKERWTTDKRTKILCSTNNKLFRWIPTNTSKVRYLTGCRQVLGGWSPNDILITIGRANQQGRTITGRVYDSTTYKLHGLWIHDANMQEKIITEYEVLVFDCANPWIDELPTR